jgi:hypothetical protein
MGEYASVNIMSGFVCSSTTLRTVVSASSLCVTLVCDFYLAMYVLLCLLAHGVPVRMMSSAIFIRP